MKPFKISKQLAERVRRAKLDWISHPRFARRELSETVIRDLSGYIALRRAVGKLATVTLISIQGVELDVWQHLQPVWRVPDDIAVAIFAELREWVRMGQRRSREYSWGTFSAEGAWLWLIPKQLPLDTWAIEERKHD